MLFRSGFFGVPGADWGLGVSAGWEEPGEGVSVSGVSFLGRVGRLGRGLKRVGAPFFTIS